jgi:16S rRNA (cytosine967-C5)-methyltransferase
MAEKTAREIALDLLLRIEKGGAYSDRILSGPLVAGLDSRDRSFIRELVSGVERWKLRLDRTIDLYYTKRANMLSPEIRMVLRLGIYQLGFLDSIPSWAAVNESVNMADRAQGKAAGGLVNAILRRYTREGEPGDWPADQAERLSQEHSYPLWLTRRWLANFGPETAENILRASNERHPVLLRANRLKMERGGLIDALAREGYLASALEEMPAYVSVPEPEGLFDTALFREGVFTAQDPSAGMAPSLLDPMPGESVLDLCAAPGGKTTHLAELMGDRGQILAVDTHPGRLAMVTESAGRLGIASISTVAGDALTFGAGEERRFDRVLLDAPCMGTAVFSKRLDMKWRREEADIARLAELQHAMLENAALLLKPGGILVYSTCSLEPEENTLQIENFLDGHPEFSAVTDERFDRFKNDRGFLILPNLMRGTGAFAAKMKRV